MRYEAAVRANVRFHTQQLPHAFPPPQETVVIEFEGRRFVWHVVGPDDEGNERWPIVTTMVADPNDYAVERIATERFLSALAYWTQQPVEIQIAGGAGWPGEMDRPTVSAARRGLGDHVHTAPQELVVAEDPRLKVVFGYYREGLNTDSPFFRFLAFWNALDVACEDAAGMLPGWIQENLPRYEHLRRGDEPAPADWWEHLQNERRSAVAHAVRDPARGPALDPNDPEDQLKLRRDADMLEELVRQRVHERWGEYPIWARPREP